VSPGVGGPGGVAPSVHGGFIEIARVGGGVPVGQEGPGGLEVVGGASSGGGIQGDFTCRGPSSSSRIYAYPDLEPIILTRDNWRIWSKFIVCQFVEWGLVYCLERDCTGDHNDVVAQLYMLQTSSEWYKMDISHLPSAYQMWQHLHKAFQAETNYRLLVLLHEKKNFRMKPKEKFQDFVVRGKALLAAIRNTGERMHPLELRQMVVDGLPPGYEGDQKDRAAIWINTFNAF
jgi:gag-polypeptide of LTR copia-type